MKRGRYVVFEGPEGCGKGTHSNLFYDWLTSEGIDCVSVREPGGTHGAEEIRKNLKNLKLGQFEKLMLMEGARRNLFENKIIPSLDEGKWVISDRDKLSSIVYQGDAGGINKDFIYNLNEPATMGVNPDLYILIDVDAETGSKNELERDQLGGDIDFRRKVRRGYLNYASKNNDVLLLNYLEGQEGIEEMQSQIKSHLLKNFSEYFD